MYNGHVKIDQGYSFEKKALSSLNRQSVIVSSVILVQFGVRCFAFFAFDW